MKLEITIKAGFVQTTVVIDGDRFYAEKIYEAIKRVFENDVHISVQ